MSLFILPALCHAAVVPGTADVAFAAVMVALKELKKLAAAVVTSETVAVEEIPVRVWAADWLAETADLSSPKDESCAVVESRSD